MSIAGSLHFLVLTSGMGENCSEQSLKLCSQSDDRKSQVRELEPVTVRDELYFQLFELLQDLQRGVEVFAELLLLLVDQEKSLVFLCYVRHHIPTTFERVVTSRVPGVTRSSFDVVVGAGSGCCDLLLQLLHRLVSYDHRYLDTCKQTCILFLAMLSEYVVIKLVVT